MNKTSRTDPVKFTSKGQIVIPVWLRKQFHIEEGTKAIVQATTEGILLKPVTVAAIKQARGILKKEGEAKSIEESRRHKKAEKELEDRYAK